MFSWQLAEIVHFCFLSIFIYFILSNENVLFKILKCNTYWKIIIKCIVMNHIYKDIYMYLTNFNTFKLHE